MKNIKNVIDRISQKIAGPLELIGGAGLVVSAALTPETSSSIPLYIAGASFVISGAVELISERYNYLIRNKEIK